MTKGRNGTWKKIGFAVTIAVLLVSVTTAFVWTQADVKANAECNTKQDLVMSENTKSITKVEKAIISIDTNLRVLVEGYEPQK